VLPITGDESLVERVCSECKVGSSKVRLAPVDGREDGGGAAVEYMSQRLKRT
jgi:hypothetical protein